MPLVDNVNMLKNDFFLLWKQWEEYRQKEQSNLWLVQTEDSRSGARTLVVETEGRRAYLHSRYDPLREAAAILEEYKNLDDNTTVIFYGTGLGYHITAFAQENPTVDFFIYEPVPEVFDQYMAHGELSKLPLSRIKNIVLADTEQQAVSFFKNFIERINNKLVIIPLPSHKTVFPEDYKQFQELFNKLVKETRSSLRTNYAFQKRWTINSIKNFKEVLNTPNILMEKKGAFTAQPALLVAAGPSLNDEIERVRYVKDNGLAYIFSVGSAINTLIENNIYPHAACTYDPTEHNQKVFTKVVDRGIKDIPLVFGSSVGYETLEKYPGRKYHMLTSQDTVSAYFLKGKDGQELQGVYDAPSIAVVTLQLLHLLGFAPIILVGQNLAYKGKERHSAGVDYSHEVTEQEMKNGLWVKDVFGREVLTDEGFNRMRRQMEMYLEKLSGINVINTTQGGADIKGAPFIPLEEVMRQYLKKKVTAPDWLPVDRYSYDTDYLVSQLDKMDEAYSGMKKTMHQVDELLKKIRLLAVNGNFDQLKRMYPKLDETMKKVEENSYFKVFIQPMNRVYRDILGKEAIYIREEKEPRAKAEKVINAFGKFLWVCNKDMSLIESEFEEIRKAIWLLKNGERKRVVEEVP